VPQRRWIALALGESVDCALSSLVPVVRDSASRLGTCQLTTSTLCLHLPQFTLPPMSLHRIAEQALMASKMATRVSALA
jgi:hypothetical protein